MLIKNKVKQSFAAASSAYDSVALLQQRVGATLLQRIVVDETFGTVVDLGCGTGFLLEGLIRQTACLPEQLIALDIAFPMLQMARHKLKNKATYLCGDVDTLSFLPQSVDAVLSNLAFQWCVNLEKTFAGIKQILKPGGMFYFTIFGQQTLHELKTAWKEVDDYTHVNSFCSEALLIAYLQQGGFQQIMPETQTYVSTYKSVWDLMTELKQLGAHTVLEGSNKQLTSRAAMQGMIAAYQGQNVGGLIPATFEVITVSARA